MPTRARRSPSRSVPKAMQAGDAKKPNATRLPFSLRRKRGVDDARDNLFCAPGAAASPPNPRFGGNAAQGLSIRPRQPFLQNSEDCVNSRHHQSKSADCNQSKIHFAQFVTHSEES